MIIEPAFINFLAHDVLSVDHVAIRKLCLNQIKNDGASSREIILKEDLNMCDAGSFSPLIKLVEDKMNVIHKQFGFKRTYKQKIVDCWFNKNLPYGISEAHIHGGGKFFSAVYYAHATEKSGKILFFSPIAVGEYILDPNYIDNFNEFNMSVKWVQPRTGMLIIFPSWLRHQVFNDDPERISIAFNSKIVENGV